MRKTTEKGYPDFYSYCNRCIHQRVCEYYRLVVNIDEELGQLTKDIKERREMETGEDVNFYGLIVLARPCPYFKEEEASE